MAKKPMQNNPNETTSMKPSELSDGGLAGLQAMVQRTSTTSAAAKKRGPAPVEKWNPDYCGELDIVIKSDGTWFYMGTPIGRKALVDLFATVLRKDEDGETYLVTPVERIKISVEDAHFIAVEMNASLEDGEKVLTFRTNVGDIVEASSQNPLRFVTVPGNDGIKPYLKIRGRLEALLARPVMYELISHGEEIMFEGQKMFAIRSRGTIFPIMQVDELAARAKK